MEPSWFFRADNAVVMVFRDQNSTFRRLASLSRDRGITWSTPVVTDMPDSRSKQSAGNLPDGTAFQVGNPVDTNIRIPLAVSLSHDGQVFDKAFVLRKGGSDLQARRYTGTSKTPGYSYPKSMVWQGSLYVSYATNKEDVEYTRVPLASLSLNSPVLFQGSISGSNAGAIKIIRGSGGIRKISLQGYGGDGGIQIFELTGRLVYSGRMENGEAVVKIGGALGNARIASVKTHNGRESQLFCNW